MKAKFSHPSRRWLAALVAAAVVLGAAWAVLFRVNRFTLSLRLAGEGKTQLEYGEDYQEKGAKAVLTGTLFWRHGLVLESVEPVITGAVDERTLGRYTLDYTADFLGFHAREERLVCVVDTVCPVITLREPEGPLMGPRHGPEVVATDNYDGDITPQVVCVEEGEKLLYAVVDSSGNPAYAQWQIPAENLLPPEICLEGGEDYAITTGSFYTEPGFRAEDSRGHDLTDRVAVAGEVDWLTPGIYPVTYTVQDDFGHETVVTRQVAVTAVPRPQVQWPGNRTIYLTFDDGPGPYTRQLLDVLDSYGVKATFFVTDTGYDDVMQEIVDRGHSIGIHTVSHRYSEIYADPEAYFADLHQMQDIIYANTGVRTTLVRFPGGSSNTISRASCEGIMAILSQAVQDAGFQYFDWNVDSDDAGAARKAKTVYENVVEGVQNTGVAIVLQHDIHAYSVEAVEDILVWGLNNGYTFAPLTETSPGFHHNVFN